MNITACSNRSHTRRDDFDGNCFDCADAAMGIAPPQPTGTAMYRAETANG